LSTYGRRRRQGGALGPGVWGRAGPASRVSIRRLDRCTAWHRHGDARSDEQSTSAPAEDADGDGFTVCEERHLLDGAEVGRMDIYVEVVNTGFPVFGYVGSAPVPTQRLVHMRHRRTLDHWIRSLLPLQVTQRLRSHYQLIPTHWVGLSSPGSRNGL